MTAMPVKSHTHRYNVASGALFTHEGEKQKHQHANTPPFAADGTLKSITAVLAGLAKAGAALADACADLHANLRKLPAWDYDTGECASICDTRREDLTQAVAAVLGLTRTLIGVSVDNRVIDVKDLNERITKVIEQNPVDASAQYNLKTAMRAAHPYDTPEHKPDWTRSLLYPDEVRAYVDARSRDGH